MTVVGVGVSGRVVAVAVAGTGVIVAAGGIEAAVVGEPPEQATPSVASNSSRLIVKNMRICLEINRRCITTDLYEISTGDGSLGLERAEYSTPAQSSKGKLRKGSGIVSLGSLEETPP